MAKDKTVVDPQAVVKSYLRWIADGQPNITRCQMSHATLHDFCKSRGVAALTSIATEILKIV